MSIVLYRTSSLTSLLGEEYDGVAHSGHIVQEPLHCLTRGGGHHHLGDRRKYFRMETKERDIYPLHHHV